MGGKPALRIRGSGEHLRLRVRQSPDPLATVRESCRAATAVDKALGEAIREAVASGHTWGEIGAAMSGSPSATDSRGVLDDYAAARRSSWRRSGGLGKADDEG
jgi:hypothetical protein